MRSTSIILTSILTLTTGAPSNIGLKDLGLKELFETDFGLGGLSSSSFGLGGQSDNSGNRNFGTGDIIKQVRSLANTVKSTLRNLNNDPKSAIYVNKVIKDENNVCIEDLDMAIDEIEYGTQLVEAAGDDIKHLIYKVKDLQSMTEASDIVREISNIFRILEPLVKNLSPDSRFICQGKATPKQAFASLQSLAYVIKSLSEENQFNIKADTKRKLKDAGNAVTTVANFLNKLRRNFSKLKQICTSDKQYNLDSLSAIGSTMEDLAEIFRNLGDTRGSKILGKGKSFVNTLVRELNNIDNLGLGDLDCGRPGDFSVAAETMEDIATLIDDVGVEELQNQLGIKISFDFQ